MFQMTCFWVFFLVFFHNILFFLQLLKDNLITNPHEANYLLQNALQGLQELGEHDSNQGLLLSFCTHVYEKLRPKFPELRDSLTATANCDNQTLDVCIL